MAYRPAISSLSLGLPSVHPLPGRIEQAARYGFDLELFHDDIVEIAAHLPAGPRAAQSQLQAAAIVRSLCDNCQVRIVCLQPFRHYEGLKDRQKHAERAEEMKLWICLAKTLGTDLIGIPSTFLPETEASGDIDLIVQDLREVADLGIAEGMRFTYEALAWGTYIDTWEECWEVVLRVDRPNFGICLDTFNLAGRVYADPASPSGKTPDADATLAASLGRLKERVDLDKVFWVQVVDAQQLSKPLNDKHPYHIQGQPARMSWSRNCRLFYGEQDLGAYLPIRLVLQTILVDMGFRGCLSAELFNKSLGDPDPRTPEKHARRAAISWRTMMQNLDLVAEA